MTKNGGELLFLALGGVGEIGMNLSLYGYAGKWLMVDLGITFADDSLPGIDLVMADPGFIVERREDLVGLVLTHAHEDHLGAVPHLWPRLRCPVYATPFTAAMLRPKLAEAGLLDQVPLHEVAPGGRLELGPFAVRYIRVTHSIPESHALAIRTALGTVVHSGDWKLDPEPLVGPSTDEAAFEALGDAGVEALICDSTNVFQAGESGSEAAVRASLMELVGGCEQGLAVTTFASHIARIETLATVAAAHGRHAALVGRALWRTVAVAKETGYLGSIERFLSPEEAAQVPPDKLLLICTGCQGEPRGAMARIAFDDHPQISLGAGDTVVYSSKMIPGNERAIGRVHNQLVRKGIEVITEKDRFVHVSGHPCRGEIERLYRLVRPRAAVPVHGEARHLAEHAELARSFQVPEVVVAENGAVVRLAPGPAAIVDHVPAGRLVLDGATLVAAESPVVRTRRRLMQRGSAVVTIVVDDGGHLVAPPMVVVMGLEGGGADQEGEAAAAVSEALAKLPRSGLKDDDALAECARRAALRSLKASSGRRPLVEARVTRLDSFQRANSGWQAEAAS
ncbi:MAG: MBL fold metallo-hydrolase RNA specificity domain-containing protein [Alphaproteobacteria bacterium]